MLGLIGRSILGGGRRWLRSLGYDVVRRPRPDLSLYAAYPETSRRERRFYNVGAGDFYHPFWTNVDYASEHYAVSQHEAFVSYDLMALQPLPLDNGSAEIIYSSHTIEHVSDAAVENLLREAWRVLKPGGVIRLTTPDARLDYAAFMRGDRAFWYNLAWHEQHDRWRRLYRYPPSQASLPQIFLHHFASQVTDWTADPTASHKYTDSEIEEAFRREPRVETLDLFTRQCRFNIAFPASHVNWWTVEKLSGMLRAVGFDAVSRSAYAQSTVPALRETTLFDNTHPAYSLYVEAVR